MSLLQRGAAIGSLAVLVGACSGPDDAASSYELTRSADGNFLSFVLVDDDCQDRINAFAMWRTWQRGGPPY